MTYKTQLKKRVLAGLLAGTALWLGMPAALAASGVVPNTQLPQGGHFINGGINDVIGNAVNGQMTITQESQNAVIQWDKGFNVGANATVNFKGPESGYNTLNYDASGNMSQIYGAINANNNGNIYIVNPAGVEISSSAQINVGSLYVSNKKMETKDFTDFQSNAGGADFVLGGTTTDAALMSLGNINADHVTFEGRRIVIDTERLKSGDNKMTAENINVRTTDAGQVVLGYDAYDADKKTYAGANNSTEALVTVNGKTFTKADGYMWVEDIEQLQAVNTNRSGQYALRNSIDATATQDWVDSSGNGKGFVSIGSKENSFTGKFDGLDYNIFNLNIDRAGESNVGLFGMVGSGSVIQNVILVGGSITGGFNVGALAGSVQGSAQISNIMNSASVTGSSDVGGIIGSAASTDQGKPVLESLVNTGTVAGTAENIENNVGGLIGFLSGGNLSGTSYNLGGVTGEGYNVGGLVGTASDAILGGEDDFIYNRLNVSGKYNVGGIVGSMTNTTVQNAENSGNVTATGHTTEAYKYHTAHTFNDENVDDNGVRTETVNIANAGGIAGTASGGSKISDVQNSGDVSSGMDTKDNGGYTFYTAGNVGGIVGRAEDTNITDATNTENDVRGAHNVGGIAGYFGSTDTENTDVTYTITRGVNNGGDILATGAVDKDTKESTTSNELTRKDGFITEYVRGGSQGSEQSIIGNIGGIAGYMYGDNVYIASSANRGTVHSQDISTEKVLPVNQAANAGGIVGKIDRSETLKRGDGQSWEAALTSEGSSTKYDKAAVSNSYSTGDVRGYMGVGGIAGMMYNGEIAGSYNLGTVNTTRNAASFGPGSYYSVNMGGIVGDTTEGTNASALLYDVYNKGQIGDETFTYYARHVGGIVGRLSGTVEKAYNTGAIYNGYNVVGGIAGWFAKGTINNSFNTGNITVANKENSEAGVQAGGIAGGAYTGQTSISNVYNLGTIRGFQTNEYKGGAVGGIVGAFIGDGKASISNAYTTGNLYLNIGGSGAEFRGGHSSTVGLGSIYGSNGKYTQTVNTENTYYIRPDDGLPFTDLYLHDQDHSTENRDNSNKAIEFDYKDNIVNGEYVNQYTYTDGNHIVHSLGFSSQNGGGVDIEAEKDWRIYEGSTPILNAFLPNAEDYFSKLDGAKLTEAGIGSIQYGTAYDPLLTIIKANEKGKEEGLSFNWQDLKINNDAGLAVYGAGLTLNDFMSTGGSGYFGGLIYSDGALTLNAHLEGDTHDAANTNVTGDVALGSASQLYGSSVAINADGQVTIYGSVTATGNVQDGTSWSKDEHKYTGEIAPTDGSVSISGGSVDIYGQLTSADGQPVKVPGINGMAAGWSPETDRTSVSDPKDAMSDIGDRFSYTTGKYNVTGNISIAANDAEDGHVNIYYGNKGEGIVTTGGNLEVTASGDIYMDSDLKVGGGLTLTSPGEMVLDLTNIGQVQADKGLVTDALTGLHEFMHQFETGGNTISFRTNTSDGTAADAKLTVDMWNDKKNAYDLTKYDTNDHTFKAELDQLNFTVQGDEAASAAKYTYIWVSTGEQLAGIQQAADTNPDFLGYNFALKNDIDASQVQDYKAIGMGSEYKGTFDGRDHRIIGLKMEAEKDSDGNGSGNAGIFDTIGKNGTVEDLRVYSGTFTGTANAGAVAGVNNGNISNVTTFGNVVESANHAGGIAGENSGTISGASAIGTSTVTADKSGGVAGGIAGTNSGTISDSSANSAVDSSSGDAAALGGVVGVNAGELNNVDSLGVTTGIYKVEGEETKYSDNVGGIAGTNSGTVTNAYNESIVSGRNNVGGILGVNTGASVTDVSNAARVTGEAASNDTSDYVGGLVGSNSGSITNGRNNGEITGNQYVGGLVGENGKNSTLSNLVNDEAASITGDNYVGGIAGRNYGTISANDKGLVNRGSITGQMYVGGVAGSNEDGGIITNTISSIALHVKTPYISGQDESTAPKYFGGVVGQNSGTINGATNESSVDVAADGATMVGGIIGENTKSGKLAGDIANEGLVSGKSNVGGIIGSNQNTEILKNDDKNDRLVVSNSGRVQAVGGGAAGIFYNNTGAINNADLTNTGMVIGGSEKDSITGGLFGTNSGNITNSTLTNNGTVYGGGTVGGLIGKNTGDISTSSLINSVDGKVIGRNNVGGLIGQNYGTITGGRTEKNEQGKDTDVGYYKYQIYNNGTITVGTWTDGSDGSDPDGKIADGEIKTDGVSGSNIGGLVGLNGYDEETKKTGSITAAYNTGAIMAGGSTNVGGIAGTNTGKLDQVFNTVITGVNADSSTQYGSITGGTSVGGIVGFNEAGGTVFNAYNTTDVSGNAENAVVGGIAGTNSGTISNVYTTVSGDLVGSGSGTVTNGYKVADTDTSSASYVGFDFTGTNGNSAVWKIYEGSTNPLLKVFLTKVTYDPKNDQHLVYNGKEQTLDVIGSGFTAADGFAAHTNVSGGLIYHNVTGEHKNAGTYTDNLWSEQIKAGSTDGTFNPNNLGYDVQSVGYTIDRATLDVTLRDIYRQYGNSDMYTDADRTSLNNDYTGYWTISVDNQDDFDTNVLEKDLAQISSEITDDGKADGKNGRKTADAGNHDWSVAVDISAISQNYQLKDDISASVHTYEGVGKSHVAKADLTIGLSDVNRTYGDTKLTNNTKYEITKAELVNGDRGLSLSDEAVVDAVSHDGALMDNGTKTNNAGDDYTWTVDNEESSFSGVNNLFNNYNVTIEAGKSTVAKKKLSVSDVTASIMYGNQNGQGFTVTGGTLDKTGIVYNDKVSLDTSSININDIEGHLATGEGTYKDNRGGRTTADVGTYTNSLSYSGLTLTGDDAGNYYIDGSASGTIEVTKASLTVGLGEVHRTYGDADITNTKDGYTAIITGELVNGDENLGYGSDDLAVTETSDGALYIPQSDGRVTNDVGTYEWIGTVSGKDGTLTNLSKNYEITVDGAGKSTVSKATITVGLDTVERTYGDETITNNGGNYGVTIISGVTNGDEDDYNEDNFDVEVKKDWALAEENSEGRVTNDANTDGEFYTYTGTVTSTDERLNKNYNIVVNGSENNIGTGNSYVDKANLTINLSDVNMTYGQQEDTVKGHYDYAASETEGQKLVNGDELKDVITGMTYGNTAYNSDGSTKDVTEGGYELEAGTVIKGTMAGNYNITYNNGTVDMGKANITVKLNDVERVYGSTNITKGSYGVASISGITNGDSYTTKDFTVDVDKDDDKALAADTSGSRVTDNVGDYTYTGTVTSTNDSLNNNYNIVVDNSTLGNNTGTGNSKVNKAVIEVSAGSHEIYVGEPEPNYTGTDIGGQLVNGDTIDKNAYWYEPEKPVDTSQTGSVVIGIRFTDGSYYVAGGDWSDAWSGFKNYEVTFTPGTLTIKDLPSGMPDISDSERWNTLLRDAPWDRNRNFRERKAEVHFLAGGMTL